MTVDDPPVSRTEQAPWWDKFIPAVFVGSVVASYPLWRYHAPEGYFGLWPVVAVGCGAVGVAVFLLIMEAGTDD